ncbi:hypothetical protein FAP48_18950 [Morganella morganii]|nr:hypothetical protein [Morganella morganii]EGT3636328.1 hypothetical protein [Morganella morganii]
MNKILSLFNKVDLLSLFLSKLGTVIIGVLFLPLYSKYLTQGEFGIFTVILSLQALATMLDFGTSIIISRDIAIRFTDNKKIISSNFANSELVISILYLSLLVLFLLITPILINNYKYNYLIMLMAVIMIWSTVLQNIYFNTLIASKKYHIASLTQLAMLVLKGALSIITLIYSNDFLYFILTQSILCLLHLFVLRIIVFKLTLIENYIDTIKIKNISALLVDGRKLLFLSISGALVLHMDKIVIAQFNGASSLGPYYLANAFCMLPLSVLATPIMQYFQPKIIFDMNSGNSDVGHLKTFTITLILFTLTPSIIILLNIDTIINLWLNNDDSTISIVVTYIKILLPGVFFGAIGFIPYNLLIAIKDFKFQAICGTVLTFLTLSLTLYFAYKNNIKSICYVYSIYHFVSTVAQWLRCVYNKKTRHASLKITKIALSIIIPCCIIYIVLIYIK